MDNYRNHIRNLGKFKIVPPNNNENELIPPPPPILKRSPRGIHCGVTNPPYDVVLMLKEEVVVNQNCIKWYFIDTTNLSKDMTWYINPNNFQLTWEATHLISPSTFYTENLHNDYDIQLL